MKFAVIVPAVLALGLSPVDGLFNSVLSPAKPSSATVSAKCSRKTWKTCASSCLGRNGKPVSVGRFVDLKKVCQFVPSRNTLKCSAYYSEGYGQDEHDPNTPEDENQEPVPEKPQQLVYPGMEYIEEDNLHWYEAKSSLIQSYARKYSERAWRRVKNNYLHHHNLSLSFEMKNPFVNRDTATAIVDVYDMPNEVLIYVTDRDASVDFVNYLPRKDWGAPVTTNLYKWSGYPYGYRLAQAYHSEHHAITQSMKRRLRRKCNRILDTVALKSSKNIVIMSTTESQVARLVTLALSMSLAVEDYVRGTTIPRIYPIILRSKNPVDEVIRDDDNVMTKNIFYNDINIQSHPVAIFSSKFGRLNYEADFLAVEPAYWASMAEISATPGQPDSTSTSNSIDYRQILLEAIDYMNAAKSQSVEPSSDGEVEDVPDVTGQLLDMDFICDEQS